MLSLNTRLNTIGITAARGVDLAMQRDQAEATLPQEGDAAAARQTTADSSRGATPKRELTLAERRLVHELQQVDRAVRAHEQAHLAAGGGVVTGGASFTYTYGPDGKQYATGGEVGIDTSPEREPQANIDKGQRIQAAALAPSDPSPQDYQVAAVGSRLEGQGRSELAHEQQQEAIAAEEAARERRAAASGETNSRTDEETAPESEDVIAGERARLVRDAYAAGELPARANVDTFA